VDQLTAARERVARLERELAVARAEVRALEQATRTRSAASPGNPQPTVTAMSSTAEKIALFRSRFAGRTDAYALRWTSRKTGRTGWGPAVRGGFFTEQSTDADLLPLDDAVIERHLRGNADRGREFHAGLYPVLAGDRCRLLACDFDDGEWRDDAAAFVGACRAAGIDSLAEISRSGAGAHVWIFFDVSVPASDARAMGAHLLRAAMAHRPSMTMSSYDRFFPAQDTLPQRSPGRFRLGNLIALPLQGDCRRRQTTVFADPQTWQLFDDQFPFWPRCVRSPNPSCWSSRRRRGLSVSVRTKPPHPPDVAVAGRPWWPGCRSRSGVTPWCTCPWRGCPARSSAS
jgi:hypothetical protein